MNHKQKPNEVDIQLVHIEHMQSAWFLQIRNWGEKESMLCGDNLQNTEHNV